MNNIKIGYFADGPWAHKAFEKLISDASVEIKFICLRYSKRDPVLIEYAKCFGIPVLLSPDVNSKEFVEQAASYNADLFVSMSFDQIFKKRLMELPALKTINCHAGKLPFYRGRNILNWVLINDEKEFGITVHYVDEGIDTGNIILQKKYPITDNDDYSTLLSRAYEECADVLYEAIKMLQNDKVIGVPQNLIDPVGIYCGMRKAGDELIEWNQSSREIFNFVRALCEPGPMATSYIGENEIKINKVRMVQGAHKYKGIAGQVLGKTELGFYVKTKDTMVEVLDYHFKGRIKTGDRLK